MDATTTLEPRRKIASPVVTPLTARIAALRMLTRGAYDLQKLRIQTGLRLYANFRNKLGVPEKTEGDDEKETTTIIDQLRASYKALTISVARNRTLPDKKSFTGDAIVSDFSELVMIDQFLEMEKQETKQFRQLLPLLEDLPIYNTWLKHEIGIGPAMAAVLVTYLDPYKAERPSTFWAYAGLDVAPDGAARSRRREHLIEREYIDKDGNIKTKLSVTYNPWFHDRLLGAMAVSMLRAGSRYRKHYDNYKHRLQTDPNRIKMTEAEKSKRRKAGASKEELQTLWTPGRIHLASMRYMVKMFIVDFWTAWRKAENLPWVNTYAEDKLGLKHGAPRQATN